MVLYRWASALTPEEAGFWAEPQAVRTPRQSAPVSSAETKRLMLMPAPLPQR